MKKGDLYLIQELIVSKLEFYGGLFDETGETPFIKLRVTELKLLMTKVIELEKRL